MHQGGFALKFSRNLALRCSVLAPFFKFLRSRRFKTVRCLSDGCCVVFPNLHCSPAMRLHYCSVVSFLNYGVDLRTAQAKPCCSSNCIKSTTINSEVYGCSYRANNTLNDETFRWVCFHVVPKVKLELFAKTTGLSSWRGAMWFSRSREDPDESAYGVCGPHCSNA